MCASDKVYDGLPSRELARSTIESPAKTGIERNHNSRMEPDSSIMVGVQ